MRYFGKDGKLIKKFCEPRPFMRAINIIVGPAFDTHAMLQAMLKEDKDFLKEVHFDHKHKLENGTTSHTYKLFFEIPFSHPGDAKIFVNDLTARIEKRIEQECKVVLRNVHDRNEYWRRQSEKHNSV